MIAACLKLTAELLLLKRPKSMASIRMMKSKKPPKNRSSLLILFISFGGISYQLFQAFSVRIRRQCGKDFECFLLVGEHLCCGVFHTSVCLYKGNDLGYFLCIFVVVLHQVDDPSF